MDCSPPGSSIHWIFQARVTGVGCHFLLQGIFPTQGLNRGLPCYRQTPYHLSHQGSPLQIGLCRQGQAGWGVGLKRVLVRLCLSELPRAVGCSLRVISSGPSIPPHVSFPYPQAPDGGTSARTRTPSISASASRSPCWQTLPCNLRLADF